MPSSWVWEKRSEKFVTSLLITKNNKKTNITNLELNICLLQERNLFCVLALFHSSPLTFPFFNRLAFCFKLQNRLIQLSLFLLQVFYLFKFSFGAFQELLHPTTPSFLPCSPCQSCLALLEVPFSFQRQQNFRTMSGRLQSTSESRRGREEGEVLSLGKKWWPAE